MIEITQKIFDTAYIKFIDNIKEHSEIEVVNFQKHPFIEKRENYKYAVLNEAKNALIKNTWKEKEIGKGRILQAIKNSIQTSVTYNYNSYDNNLINWRKKDNFEKVIANRNNEQLFFDFFKNKIDDKRAFESFQNNNFSYQLIAYLFFIKNSNKYMPISQERFDLIFNSLNIDFKTNNNCSWDNYTDFIGIIKSTQRYLSTHYKDIQLLDAHSFLWIYGYQFDIPVTTKIKQTKKKSIIRQTKNKELEIYQPKQTIDLNKLPENESEIDYDELNKRFKEIGNLAEKIVLESEKNFLEPNFPELAKKVRSVANDPKLGFDIVSFETNGKQKQIEVKAISISNKIKSFILTRNELKKSKIYSNYFVYCVSDLQMKEPKILRIKNPNFEDDRVFSLEPLRFKVTFE